MERNSRLASVAALALLIGAQGASADDTEAWRLFVADREQPKVTVIDVLDGKTIETFELKGPATLQRSGGGQSIFAIQGDDGVVTAFDSGISFDDHGDHGDIHIGAPKPTGVVLTGAKPAHFVEVQGNIAQWFDGETEVRVLAEKDVLAGKGDVRTAGLGAAHHGVAVPYANHVVVSIPNPEDASKRPIGARVVDFSGNQVGDDAACPGLHGSAGSGSLYALACDTGLLLIRQEGAAPAIEHLPYAVSLPEGSSSTLIGGKGLQYFIGNFGPDRIVLIDPAGGDGFRLVQLPTRRVTFAVDPIRPKFAYVFTEDGQLHRVDVVAGTIDAPTKLTEPYSMDGHWNDPRPRIAVAGDRIVVTDPLAGKLRLVDAETLAEVGEIAVEGKPFNIVAVGGSGRTHEDE